MYKYILEGAGDINWMAIFALLTFFLLFVISAFTIMMRKKDYVDKMANMPLDEFQLSSIEIETKHEK